MCTAVLCISDDATRQDQGRVLNNQAPEVTRFAWNHANPRNLAFRSRLGHPPLLLKATVTVQLVAARQTFAAFCRG